jgi:hypothetical protein
MSVDPSPQSYKAALFEVGKLVAIGGLTLGAVLLTAFGLIERVVGFDRLASETRYALAALLPGGAAVAFLAAARGLGAVYDITVPPRPVGPIRRAGLRALALSGGYGMFGLVVSGLVSVSVGLAVALFTSDFAGSTLVGPTLVGAAAFLIALVGMLTRASRTRAVLDSVLVAVLVAMMAADRWL